MELSSFLDDKNRLVPTEGGPVSTECVFFCQSMKIDQAAQLCQTQSEALTRRLLEGKAIAAHSSCGEGIGECYYIRLLQDLYLVKGSPPAVRKQPFVMRIYKEKLRTFVLSQPTEAAKMDAAQRVQAYLGCLYTLKERIEKP